MAATNFTPIQLYHSTTASAAPTSGNLVNGELAINITDGKLYYKDNGGTVQIIASKGTGTIGGSTTQVQYNLSGALAGSSNFVFDGTTATINTLNLTNALGATYGGTAQSSWTTGDLLYASGSNTLAKLGIGLNTYILTSNGSIPGWAAPSAISVNTATNLAGGAAGSVPYQSGPGATTFLSIGTANQVVTSTGSAPQWSSGLSITTLTASDAVTFSATTQNIALGTSQTSGTFTVGGTAQTGNIAIDRSTKTHTLNIGTGITESGQTKTINIGTAGDTGSTTAITIGSANGTTITVNGTVNASTLDLTNLEVTNIKAKDGTASMTLADTTGNVTVSSAFAANGGVTIGDASGDAFTINSSAVSTPNGLNFDSNTLVIDAANDRVGVGTASPANKLHVNGAAENVHVILTNSTTGATISDGFQLICETGTANAYVLQRENAPILFYTNNTEKMRLLGGTGTNLNIGGNFTSTNNTLQVTGNAAIGYTTAAPTTGLIVAGNVGIGTDSPSDRLTVVRSTVDGAATATFINSGSPTTTTQSFRLRLGSFGGFVASPQLAPYVESLCTNVGNGDSALAFGTYGSGAVAERARIDSSGTLILRQSSNAANTSVSFNTTVQNALTLDSSGNLGLGVTPSAWDPNIKAIDINAACLSAYTSSSPDVQLVNNAFYNGTNWIYKTTNTAGRFRINGNQHEWYRAASGTQNTTVSFTQAMTLDASGNLVVGHTSAFLSSANRGNISINGSVSSVLALGVGNTVATYLYCTGTDVDLWNSRNGTMRFGTNDLERARITSGGNFGIGVTNPTYTLDVTGSTSTARLGKLTITNDTPFVTGANLDAGAQSFALGTSGAGIVAFFSNNTERARITTGGYFKASNNGTYISSTGAYHENVNSANNEVITYFRHTSATAPFGLYVNYSAAAPNGTGNSFAFFQDNAAARVDIRSNGGIANYQANDVNLSDQRTKKDIVAAPSYWDKIKGIEIVHFKYKDQTHDDNNVGVIAQQVEQVAPEFVDQDGWGETPEDGVPLKSIYTSDMYHAAIKALQEAMARIEKLEAEVAALEAK